MEGRPLKMELDTGSAVTIISQHTLEEHDPNYKLLPTETRLKTYSGEQLCPLGKVQVSVQLKDQEANMEMIVTKQEGPTLFGRDWLKALQLDWSEIKHVQATTSTLKKKVTEILHKYPEVFSNGEGKLQKIKGTLTLHTEAQPKFVKARSVPYPLRPKVEEELQALESAGIITPVEFSDWATPIVPIVKPTGDVRNCGDYKVTVNPMLKVDRYPLPKVEDIFASLAGGYTLIPKWSWTRSRKTSW